MKITYFIKYITKYQNQLRKMSNENVETHNFNPGE